MTNTYKQQIQKHFDRAATTYNDVTQMQTMMAQHLIRMLLLQTQQYDISSTIEVGCGTGNASDLLLTLEQVKQLTCTDFSEAMLEHCAKRLAKTHDIKRIPHQRLKECCYADAEQLPFSANTFQLYFANAVLQWCDLQLALQEAHRVTFKNGLCVFSNFGPKTMQNWRDIWHKIDGSQRVRNFHSIEQQQQCFENTGWQVLDQHNEIHIERFDNVNTLLASVKKMGATDAKQQGNQGLLGKKAYQTFKQALLSEPLEIHYELQFWVLNKT